MFTMADNHLKHRSDLHLARKFWHTLGVLLIVVIYHNVNRSTAVQLITLFTAVFIVADLLRLQLPSMNKAVISIFHPFLRESEREHIAGTSYLLTGVFIIIILFPKDIVSLTLLFLAVADPLASYFGVLYGKDKLIGNKSLQGSLAAFTSCAVIATVFYFSKNLMTERLLIVSILSGLIGALAELIPVGKLDDNLTFPIISASCLWGVFYLFGGF